MYEIGRFCMKYWQLLKQSLKEMAITRTARTSMIIDSKQSSGLRLQTEGTFKARAANIFTRFAPTTVWLNMN